MTLKPSLILHINKLSPVTPLITPLKLKIFLVCVRIRSNVELFDFQFMMFFHACDLLNALFSSVVTILTCWQCRLGYFNRNFRRNQCPSKPALKSKCLSVCLFEFTLNAELQLKDKDSLSFSYNVDQGGGQPQTQGPEADLSWHIILCYINVILISFFILAALIFYLYSSTIKCFQIFCLCIVTLHNRFQK